MSTGLTNIVIASSPNDYSALIGPDFFEMVCSDCAEERYEDVQGVQLQPVYDWENLERDNPEHCPSCEVLLDWDMTADGLEYVKENVFVELTGDTEGLAVTEWHAAYGEQVKESLPDSVKEHLDMLCDVETVLSSYLETQLWTGSLDYMSNTAEHNGESLITESGLDSVCSVEDLSPEVLASAREDVESFLAQVGEFLHYFPNIEELSAGQLGHDFSLTRNHHGAGFWDRGLAELGQYLTTAAEGFGSSTLWGSVVVFNTALDVPALLERPNLLMQTLTVWETN